MQKRMRSFLVLAMLFFVIAVNAQVTTASMGGKVVDATNEPLIGATVRAGHNPTGTVYNTITQSNGQYRFQNLRIGGPPPSINGIPLTVISPSFESPSAIRSFRA